MKEPKRVANERLETGSTATVDGYAMSGRRGEESQ